MANIADLTVRIEHAAAALANQAASDAQIAKLSSDLQTAQEALATQDAAYQAQIDELAAKLPAVVGVVVQTWKLAVEWRDALRKQTDSRV